MLSAVASSAGYHPQQDQALQQPAPFHRRKCQSKAPTHSGAFHENVFLLERVYIRPSDKRVLSWEEVVHTG